MKTQDSSRYWPLSLQMAILPSIGIAVLFILVTVAAMAETNADSSSADSIEPEAAESASDADNEQAKSCDKHREGASHERRAERWRYGQRGQHGPPRGQYEGRRQYDSPRGQYEGRGQYGPPRGQYEGRGQYGPPRDRYNERRNEGEYGPPRGHRRPPQRRGYEDSSKYRDSAPPQRQPDAQQQTRPGPIEETKTFKQMDLDHNGSISLEEFNQYQNRDTDETSNE